MATRTKISIFTPRARHGPARNSRDMGRRAGRSRPRHGHRFDKSVGEHSTNAGAGGQGPCPPSRQRCRRPGGEASSGQEAQRTVFGPANASRHHERSHGGASPVIVDTTDDLWKCAARPPPPRRFQVGPRLCPPCKSICAACWKIIEHKFLRPVRTNLRSERERDVKTQVCADVGSSRKARWLGEPLWHRKHGTRSPGAHHFSDSFSHFRVFARAPSQVRHWGARQRASISESG